MTETPPEAPRKKIEAPTNPLDTLARGDAALAGHRFAQALAYYEEWLDEKSGPVALIDYRMGLCHELLGRADRAIAAYRRAVSGAAAAPLSFAAHLGMARCLLRQNEPAEARRTLYPFLLDETRREITPPAFAADARYLVALAWSREAAPRSASPLTDDAPVSFSIAALEIPLYLEEIALSVTQQPKAAEPVNQRPKDAEPVKLPPALAEPKSTAFLVRKPKDDEPAFVERIDRIEGPAADLLDRLAREAGLKTEWSDSARQAVRDRSLGLCMRNLEVADVLDQAVDSVQLAWRGEGDVIRLTLPAELRSKQLAKVVQRTAKDALRRTLAASPAHPWSAAACLELGNLEAGHGNVSEAIALYTRIVREMRHSRQVSAAYFNLAQLCLREQDLLRARQALFHAADQEPGHELALRARLRIGQLLLEEGDCTQAILQLRRAQTVAPASAFHPIATLALAAAYLEDRKPDQTRAVLAQERTVLQKDPYKATAAFLDTYAQFRLTKSATPVRRESTELLSTLWRDQDQTLLGTYGQYLIAQAYRDLGFLDQAERHLRQLSAQVQGAMKPAVAYLLGDTLLQQHQRTEAGQIFAKLAATPSSHRALARLQLARIDVEERRYGAGIEKCRQLWKEQSLPDPRALLLVWGNALEGAGDYPKAALCFAGKAPE